jgi:GT2 family glycosyltransferase
MGFAAVGTRGRDRASAGMSNILQFPSAPRRRTIVGIPVRNEQERIAGCLRALDAQHAAQIDDIVLLLNNCTDATADAARAVALRPGTRLHLHTRELPPHQANAGHARRLAMQEAAELAAPGSVLLTTDADSRVDPCWLSANLAAIARGADAVAGWVDLDPAEARQLPAELHENDAREGEYDRLCDEITALLDPDPWDKLPRHTQNSGASLAVTMEAFDSCGGVPDIACGEDRAFVAALRRHDARIRHAPEVHAIVSGRIHGRAAGGMADTIRRRLQRPDEHIDDRLEPACDCARRARQRRMLRTAYESGQGELPGLARFLSVPPAILRAALRAGSFGKAWEAVERASPVLRRRLVRLADLAEETRKARAILAVLRPVAVAAE